MSNKSFVQKCLDGEADLFELDDYIEYWHKSNTGISLREFLGLTLYEYEAWGKGNDSIFRDILRCRIENISFEDYQKMDNDERIAARSYNFDAVMDLKNKKNEDE